MKIRYFVLMLAIIVLAFYTGKALAYDFDNVKDYDPDTKTVAIKNAFGLGDTLAEIRLLENSYTCYEDCYAEGIAIFYKNDNFLIDELRFEKKEAQKWVSHRLNQYDLYIIIARNDVLIDDFEWVCTNAQAKNGSMIKDCGKQKVGSHYETVTEMEKYDGQPLPAGTYHWRLEGKKKKKETVDWLATWKGVEVDEWAVWGSIGGGDASEVTLNSPANNTIVGGGLIQFDCEANTTSADNVVNISFWNNFSGTFELIKTELNAFNNYTSRGHGRNLNDNFGDSSSKWGEKIKVSAEAVKISGMTKTASDESTHGYLLNAAKVQVDTCSFVGNYCEFSPPYDLAANTEYYVISDGGGANIERWRQNNGAGVPYPIFAGLFNWTGEYRAGADGNNDIWTFETINISNQAPAQNASLSFFATVPTAGVWDCLGCDEAHDCGFSSQGNFSISPDLTSPNVTIATFPNKTYHVSGENYTLNWTIVESNLDSCWYNYNETGNITIPCHLNYTSFNVTRDDKDVFFYANDTNGNINTSVFEWTYTFWQNNISFSTQAAEGSTQNFIIDAQVSAPSVQITTSNLEYNNTSYNSIITSLGGGNYLISNAVNLPFVSGNTNKNFNWTVNFNNGEIVNTTIATQTILNFNLDDCSAEPTLLLNYTMYDEGTQAYLAQSASLNTTIETDVWISTASGIEVSNFSGNGTNPFTVCITAGIIGSGDFDLYAVTRYESTDRVSEFHNIQNLSLVAGNVPQTIGLYDLLTVDAQEFLVTYKDENFLPVEDALITVNRYYIQDGVFRTIEAPVTNDDGQTLANFVLGDVIYTIIVSKDGRLLGTFENVRAFCDNVATGECFINLRSVSTSTDPTDFDTAAGVSYNFAFDRDLRRITVTFLTLDGAAKEMLLQGVKFDNYGNETVCSNTLTTSAGVLVCTVPDSFGNFTVQATLYADDVFVASTTYNLNDRPSEIFGTNRVIFAIMLYLTIPLLFITSPIGIILGSILALIFMSLLYVVDTGSFFGEASIIMWFIIAGAILIWKIARRDTQ